MLNGELGSRDNVRWNIPFALPYRLLGLSRDQWITWRRRDLGMDSCATQDTVRQGLDLSVQSIPQLESQMSAQGYETSNNMDLIPGPFKGQET
jgi:hypothetical protein